MAAAQRPTAMPTDAADATLSLSNQLCFSVYAAANAFGRSYRPLLAPLGLTYPQYLAMLVLWERDGRTVGEIGDALHLDSGTLTPLLKRLEGMGLVVRRRTPDDERRVRVDLTPTGHALKRSARSIPTAIQQATGTDAAEIRRLRSSMERLRAALERSGRGEDSEAGPAAPYK